MGFAFGVGPGLFGIMSMLVFVLVIGTFIVSAVRGIGQWNRNNNSPKLTVPAAIVTKRTDVTLHHHSNTGAHSGASIHASTTYYVTFQVDSGDRMELQVSGIEYGMLIEGDRGELTFQGTRYLGFTRK